MNFLRSKYFSIPAATMLSYILYSLFVLGHTLTQELNEHAYQFTIVLIVFLYIYNDKRSLYVEKRELKKDRKKLKDEMAVMCEVIENLKIMANYDDLTGLPNKRLFMNKLRERLDEYHSHGKLKDKCVLFYVDVNNFKAVNDTMGHTAGDTALQEVAERLKKSVRQSDVVARLAGDEFAVLISGEVSATKVIARMGKKFPIQGIPVGNGKYAKIGISIGAVRFSDNIPDAEELLNSSDHAMYMAKFKCSQSNLISSHAWTDGLGSKIPA